MPRDPEQPARRGRTTRCCGYPLGAVLARHQQADPHAAAVELFHSVAERVPAYCAFLTQQGGDPASQRFGRASSLEIRKPL